MGKKLPTFTPIFDFLAADFPKLNLTALAVLGVVWRYCQLDAGVCFASHKTMGAKVGIKSNDTVKAALRKLVAAGLVEDLGEKPRPGGGGNTHHYALTDNFHEVLDKQLSKDDTPQQEQKPGKVLNSSTLRCENLAGKVLKISTKETDKETEIKKTNNGGQAPPSLSVNSLTPQTESEQLLFTLFNAHSTTKNKPTSFPNSAYQSSYQTSASRLGPHLETAIMAALKKPDIPLTGVINYLGGYTHKPQPQQTPYARREVCPEQEQAYWDTRRRIEREEAERAEKSKNAPPLTVEEMQRLRKQMKAGAKNLSGDNGKA